MSPKIDSVLTEKLKAPGDEQLNVEIEFTQPPPVNQLNALGLQFEGLLAWGMLSRERIKALATIPEVASVRLSNRHIPTPPAQKPQIGANLYLELLRSTSDVFQIAVRFRGAVQSPGEFPNLLIHGDFGTGRLSRAEIEQFEQRDDVISIDAIPRVHPL